MSKLSTVSKQMIPLIFILIFVTSPSNSQNHQDLVRGFALNPAEINNIYFNPTHFNYKKDFPPQPLIRSEATIEETVREVEELIKKDPKLPRLTRGEIVDIIENITKIGDGVVKNYRDEGKRALMVVMPFTAGSAQGDDIKELYTRTPVTRIIGNEDNKNGDGEKVRGKKKKPPRKWENEVLENVQNDIPSFQYLPSTTQKSSITKSKPASFSFMTQLNNNIKPINFEKERAKTETTTTTIKNPLEPDVKHTNHNYDIKSGMRVVAPSFLMTMTDDGYSVPYVVRRKPQIQPEVTIEEVKITPDMYGDTPIPKPRENFKLTTPTKPKSTTTTEMNLIKEINKIEENELINIKNNKKSENKKEASVILDEISIPNHYKGVIKDLDLLITPENDQIPYTQQILKPPHQDAPLKTPSTSPIPDIANVANNLSPEMKDLLMSFGLINKPTTKKPESSITTTEEIPYIQNVQINPQSYIRFKPLPKSSGRDDMEELLSRFGLGRNRNEKAIDFDKDKKTMKKTTEFSDLDVVPDNFKNVVKNLGFNENTIKNINKNEKHIFKPTKLNNTEEELKKLGKLLNMIKDLEEMKGNITEDSLKDFDSETLKELIGDINGNLNINNQENFLDPNQLNFDDKSKKDFKRQNYLSTEKSNIVTITPSSTVSNKTNSPISSTIQDLLTTNSENVESTTENVFIVSSISDEPKKSNLEDLESSFGNGEPQSPTEEITTTTTPRTGFYYLIDWNTFLELDNQNGKRVNLRFQPHAGNPNYFLNVQVP